LFNACADDEGLIFCLLLCDFGGVLRVPRLTPRGVEVTFGVVSSIFLKAPRFPRFGWISCPFSRIYQISAGEVEMPKYER